MIPLLVFLLPAWSATTGDTGAASTGETGDTSDTGAASTGDTGAASTGDTGAPDDTVPSATGDTGSPIPEPLGGSAVAPLAGDTGPIVLASSLAGEEGGIRCASGPGPAALAPLLVLVALVRRRNP